MNVPTWAEIVIALLVAAALGALVQVAVSRPLRTAPVLAKVVAAVGIMLTLQAALALKYGTEGRPRTAMLPTGNVKIGGANVAVDRLWFIAVVIVLGCALAAWFRWSRTGLAIQAAAENERAAAFARLSPQTLGMVTWVLATVFVSFIAILAGQSIGVLTPGNLTLLVVPALAGALIARLSSLWLALVGSLAVGVVQSELVFLSSTKDWWPDWAKQGLQDAVPFLVIVITLFILGRSIPMRGEDTRSNLPPVILPRNRPLVIAALVVAGIVVLSATSGSYRYGIITSLASALIILSLVVLTGMVGQISLAQAAFAGVAGLMISKFGTGVPFPLLVPARRRHRRRGRHRGRPARVANPWSPARRGHVGGRADAGEIRLRQPPDPVTDAEPDPEPEDLRHRPGRAEGPRHRPAAVRPVRAGRRGHCVRAGRATSCGREPAARCWRSDRTSGRRRRSASPSPASSWARSRWRRSSPGWAAR